jgi:hypothetical protein
MSLCRRISTAIWRTFIFLGRLFIWIFEILLFKPLPFLWPSEEVSLPWLLRNIDCERCVTMVSKLFL